MTNILFVSIAFPPKNDPECIQAARYFKYLKEDAGWSIDVVTSASPTLFMPVDEALKKYDTGYCRKIEVRIFESKMVNFILRKLKQYGVIFPDSKMTFHWQWRKVVDKLKMRPDLIYSRSNPMSSAVMAMKLKRHFNIPWVMHMSDPWAISPLEDVPVLQMKKALKMEEALISEADEVIFTTRQTLDLYTSRYKKYSSRFSVLPNVYDPDDIREVPWENVHKLRIVYTGGLAGKRNVFFLEEVLGKMLLKNSTLEDDLEFIFAGDMDRNNRTFFESKNPCLQHRGILSHSEAKALSQTAHLLMVVDSATSPEGAIFFPSKLLDYFLVKRKIWAITPEGSVTRDILRNSNHMANHHGEIDVMVDFLTESIRQFKIGELAAFESYSVPEAFDAEKNSKLLSAILKKAMQ